MTREQRRLLMNEAFAALLKQTPRPAAELTQAERLQEIERVRLWRTASRLDDSSSGTGKTGSVTTACDERLLVLEQLENQAQQGRSMALQEEQTSYDRRNVKLAEESNRIAHDSLDVARRSLRVAWLGVVVAIALYCLEFVLTRMGCQAPQ